MPATTGSGSLTNPETDGDPAFVPGGFPSDDETLERHALDVKKGDTKGGTKPKVSPLHASPHRATSSKCCLGYCKGRKRPFCTHPVQAFHQKLFE
jgi:hypothetical protein